MMSRPGLTILWALALATLCHAGPINRQAGGHNTLHPDVRNQSYTEQNVCVNDDVLYQPGDLMPAPTPCARCVCSPPGSLCTPVACEKRPGCKALQRSNQCCPEYHCECERNGRLYANGERLDNADNPCQACYCQGGEVVCTTVECYRRDDCEPQFVPGRCCPKYDHCPPLEMDDSRYGEPFAVGDRPQHTRATFQPSSGLEGESDAAATDDDQALGASNVQERVHVPQDGVVATATTTPETPITAPDTPAITTAAPHDIPRDASIRIDVPVVPWTETPEPTPAVSTTQTALAIEEGSGAVEDGVLLKKDEEPVTGVIEHTAIQANHDETTAEPAQETVTAGTTATKDAVEDEATETQTEQEPITRLFMVSKEAELDPTTVSTEYTDLPDEMSTTPEATSAPKETTVAVQGVDLSTEALLETTTTTKDSHLAPEASTNSSPEFKDFDEWSGSKSSEFLRDSASTGLSGGSSSGSDAHSKPAGSASDESTSHFLATNINAETVKLSSDSSSVPHSEPSSTDSTESADSVEESGITEVSSSTENENVAKTSENKDSIPETKKDESDRKEENPILQKIDTDQSTEKVKEEEDETKKSGQEKERPDIVLDSEATDENGPPILLIGDELANHQMDIVVATSSTEETETESPGSDDKPELRIKKQESTDRPTEATDRTTDQLTETTEQPHAAAKDQDDAVLALRSGSEVSAFEETRTEEPEGSTDEPATDAADDESVTKVGVTGSEDAKDAESSTEKLESATAAEEMMLSDDPLPGQAASSETVARDENLNDILGKTEDKKEDKKEDEAQGATVLTTLPADAATDDPVQVRLGDIRTESPERESTTNTARGEEGTTLQLKFEETTVAVDGNEEQEKTEEKREESQDAMQETAAERRADIAANADPVTEGQVTTVGGEENSPTTENPNTERTNAESNMQKGEGDESNTQNEESTELAKEVAAVRIQSVQTEDEANSDKELKDNQSPEEPPKDVTVVVDTTNVPTTQYPETEKGSNKNIVNEDVMLGDQAQSSLPTSRLQSTESKEQKKEEEKKQKKEEEKELKKQEENTEQTETENSTDKLQTTEPEQTTEIKERLFVDETSETTVEPASDSPTESSQTSILEQNTESLQKSETDTPDEQNTEAVKKAETDQKDETEQKSEANAEQPEQEKDIQPSEILVDSAKSPENDEVAVRAGAVHDITGDDLSTPPPDTTSSDVKIQEEAVTSVPVKADLEETPSTDRVVDTTVAPADEHHADNAATGVKINPEVLELKPPATVSAITQGNKSEAATFEVDPTTLSPLWLKSDNDTKEDSAHGHKEEQQTGDEAGAVTKNQAPAGDEEGGGQQRVERRVDEGDKKDLFLLEDFFTKLYRHQIITDENKGH